MADRWEPQSQDCASFQDASHFGVNKKTPVPEAADSSDTDPGDQETPVPETVESSDCTTDKVTKRRKRAETYRGCVFCNGPCKAVAAHSRASLSSAQPGREHRALHAVLVVVPSLVFPDVAFCPPPPENLLR